MTSSADPGSAPATASDLVASLHPPRLPEAFTAPHWGDFLAAFGLGLLAAALILLLIGPALHRRPSPPGLKALATAARNLPTAERLLVLTRLLRESGRDLPEDLRQALYAGRADPARIEALVLGRKAPRPQGRSRPPTPQGPAR